MKAALRHSLPLLVSAIAGILCGNLTDSFYGTIIALTATFLTIGWLHKLRFLTGPLIFFAIANLSAYLYNPVISSGSTEYEDTYSLANALNGKNVVIKGVVKETGTLTSGERSSVNVTQIDWNDDRLYCENIELLLYSSPEKKLHQGDIIITPVTLQYSEDREYFDSEAEFCYEAARQPVFYCFEFQTIPKVTGQSKSILTIASQINEWLCSSVDRTSLKSSTKDFIKAVIFGNKRSLSSEDKAKFADAGLSHVLAVSGMHVGIICSILLFLTAPINILRGGNRLRYILCASIIWVYVIITGLSYSAVRAAIMVTFLMIALVSGRNRSPFSSVCLAVSLILICDPHSLFSIGLWLSFTAVTGIVLLVPHLNVIDIAEHRKTYKLSSFILATLVATAATWMLSAYFFNLIPVHFLIANLLVVPLLPIYVMLVGSYLLINALMPIPNAIDHILIGIIDYPTQLLFSLLEVLSGDSIQVNMPLWGVIAYYSFFALLIIWLNRRKTSAGQQILT